jgi:hypothetical protein
MKDEARPAIEKLIDKHMGILGIRGMATPIIQLRDNVGSQWLGRTVYAPHKLPDTTTIQIQKNILSFPSTLERVVAHEIVHHRDFLKLTPNEKQLIKLGIKPSGHGPNFREGAAKINAVMGPDYVTVKSDQTYEIQQNTSREFYVFIRPAYGDNLGWSWASRISDDMKALISKNSAGRLVKSSDPRWTVGVKLKRFGGMSLPKGESEILLRQIYESAPQTI